MNDIKVQELKKADMLIYDHTKQSILRSVFIYTIKILNILIRPIILGILSFGSIFKEEPVESNEKIYLDYDSMKVIHENYRVIGDISIDENNTITVELSQIEIGKSYDVITLERIEDVKVECSHVTVP